MERRAYQVLPNYGLQLANGTSARRRREAHILKPKELITPICTYWASIRQEFLQGSVLRRIGILLRGRVGGSWTYWALGIVQNQSFNSGGTAENMELGRLTALALNLPKNEDMVGKQRGRGDD